MIRTHFRLFGTLAMTLLFVNADLTPYLYAFLWNFYEFFFHWLQQHLQNLLNNIPSSPVSGMTFTDVVVTQAPTITIYLSFF